MVIDNVSFVGDRSGFGNNIATTRYGIASIFETALKFTDNIVDLFRSFKCYA